MVGQAFSERGEMSASLNFDGKVAWVNERFARCEMRQMLKEAVPGSEVFP